MEYENEKTKSQGYRSTVQHPSPCMSDLGLIPDTITTRGKKNLSWQPQISPLTEWGFYNLLSRVPPKNFMSPKVSSCHYLFFREYVQSWSGTSQGLENSVIIINII